jgi:hypothetical protein
VAHSISAKPAGLPKNFDAVKKSMEDLINTNALSEEAKHSLIGMDSYLGHLEVEPRKMNAGFGGVKVSGARSINPKLFLARTMGGVVLTTGAMTAAQAAEVEETMDNALAFTDPVSFAMKVAASPLGGDCGMNVPSPYFPMDAGNGCNYNFAWNDKVQLAAAETDDTQLSEFFKQRGVCEAINKNYQLYYPSVASGGVRCNSPLAVKFNDGSSFSFKEDDYLITTGRKGERVGFYQKGSGGDQYSTGQNGKKEVLGAGRFEEKYPEHWSEYNRLKAVAISMQSCCSQIGMRPSEQECASYGIRSSGKRASSESQEEFSMPGTGNQ